MVKGTREKQKMSVLNGMNHGKTNIAEKRYLQFRILCSPQTQNESYRVSSKKRCATTLSTTLVLTILVKTDKT